MGEHLPIGDRTSVRTPMQWTDDRNGGFSSANARRLVRPVVQGGYGPEHVNASSQRHDPDSLLHFMRTLVARYRASAEMGWGELAILEHDAPGVLIHTLTGAEGRMVALHNVAGDPANVRFSLADATDEHRLVDLLVDGITMRPDADGVVELTMDGYGYRWFRVLAPGDKRLG